MNDNLSSFVNWTNQIMNEKNVTQADIARTGYVTRGAVSLLLTYRIKSVGVEMCRAISAATGVPLKVVYVKAGILPPDVDLDELSAEIAEETVEMTEDEKRSLLAFIRTTKNMRKGRRK